MSLAAGAAGVNAKILSLFALMMLQTGTTFFLAFMQLFALQLNCMNSERIKLQNKHQM